jgi:hypothetical protein
MKLLTITAALSLFITAGCSKEKQQSVNAVVFSAAGDVNAKLNEFRNQLGTLNTTTGVTGGRREINWDGVPDSLMSLRMPDDFFNPVGAGAPVARQRGFVYAGTGNAVVSKTNFADINAQAAPEFASFSGSKTFAVTNSNLWPVGFRVAGTNTVAAIKGFGLIASDVDKNNSTFIEFFDGDKSLGKFYLPAHDITSSFTFLGVYFPDNKITEVKIGHEGILSAGQKDVTQGGPEDLIILDDFIYSEPTAN